MTETAALQRCMNWLAVCVLLGWVGSSCTRPAAAQESATNRWEKEIKAFEEQDRKQPPPRGAVVFVGSSSIRLWKLDESFPDIATINRGFGGSQLSDSVRFASRIVIPYRPKLVVLYAGDNDLAAGKTPEQVFADFKAFVREVRQTLPETRIAYLSIKPSIKRWSLIERIRSTNRMIEEYAAGDDKLHYVDIVSPMLGDDGRPRKELFREDGLHLNAEGYRVWASALQPLLKTVAAGSRR